MDYAKLISLYVEDQGANDALTAQAVADKFNALTEVRKFPAPMRELLVYLLKANKWAGIVDAAGSPVHAVRQECLALTTVANNVNFADLDLEDATVQAMLLNIKNEGLLDANDQAAILALGRETVSLAQSRGVQGTVLATHIDTIRGMI